MALDGSHNLQILRGLSSNNSLLSCGADDSVQLWNQVDQTGRQVWAISLVPGHTDVYYIKVSNGSGDPKFLSCAQDGSGVDLWNVDDNSGRQRWQFVPVKDSTICSYYNINVDAGVSGGRTLLSCTPDGSTVDLWTTDDGSGRQRWQLQ
jgi:hypothetical protein